MARRTSFFSAALKVSRVMAAEQRRAQSAAIRQHNANIRHQNALARQAEREHKQAERERLLEEKENAIQYAADKTLEAEEKRAALISIIRSPDKFPVLVDWSMFKQLENFYKPAPRKKKARDFPPEIDEAVYQPKFGLLDKLFSSRREKIISEAKFRLQQARQRRIELVEETTIENENNRKAYDAELKKWSEEKDEFERLQREHNDEIDRLVEGLERSEVDSIELYFDALLRMIDLPEDITCQWQLQYDPVAKILVVDFDLPAKDVIPSLKLMRYVASRKEFTETFLKDKEVDQLYEEVLFQLCLRITNDLYVSDARDYLMSVVFNGIYNGINESTGKEETKCIMSLQTKKEKFHEVSIENVDAKKCFLKFKGVAGNKLAEFVPIAPLIAMDKEDSRFVEGLDVTGTINGMNLAAMDWESFEHLIRELFEKEFAINGAEVRITQASRDGGVDAVMFDPDPIRGGKYVIQAKRYTNVVGVSAVRDLYGTLMNEGAVKGILVTTANYGADSYEFAKDKPITLINGNNLLHMLQKHGYQTRIDLEEAKRLLAN